jgi:hypothetical protein
LAAPLSGLPVSQVPSYFHRFGITGEYGVPYIPTDKSGGFAALVVKKGLPRKIGAGLIERCRVLCRVFLIL